MTYGCRVLQGSAERLLGSTKRADHLELGRKRRQGLQGHLLAGVQIYRPHLIAEELNEYFVGLEHQTLFTPDKAINCFAILLNQGLCGAYIRKGLFETG